MEDPTGSVDLIRLTTALAEWVVADPSDSRVGTDARGVVLERAVDFPAEGDAFIASLLLSGVRATPEADDEHELRSWSTSWLLRFDGRICGTMGAKSPLQEGSVEFGYGVVPSVRGRGVASRGVRQLLEMFAADGATSAWAETLPSNEASIGLLTRLGFVADGEWVDDEAGRILRWRAAVEGLAV